MIDLDDAVLAARRTADAVTSDPNATRRRIRDTLERRQTGRARKLTVIGVLAATLFGSTAFAYYRKPWRHEAVPASAPPVAAIADDTDNVDTPRFHERVVVADVPGAMVDAPPAAIETGGGSKVEVAHVDTRHAGTPPSDAPSQPESPQPAQPDPELAQYRVAYDAHFHGGSPDAALAAWDAYLVAYPDGKLALDARYNRAIILVKLKRYTEAAEALRPLAATRADAARLLNALPH